MNLQLSLKTKWFEMTKLKIKSEDYREINEYWFKRLVFQYKKVFKYCSGYKWEDLDKQSREILIKKICSDPIKIRMFGFNLYDINIMTLGYPKLGDTERILKYEHKGIEIRTGNTEWGAEPGKLYFVIKHGSILN